MILMVTVFLLFNYKALAPYELALTGSAMVLLFPVVTMPVFLDLFGAAEKAFFVFKGFDLA